MYCSTQQRGNYSPEICPQIRPEQIRAAQACSPPTPGTAPQPAPGLRPQEPQICLSPPLGPSLPRSRAAPGSCGGSGDEPRSAGRLLPGAAASRGSPCAFLAALHPSIPPFSPAARLSPPMPLPVPRRCLRLPPSPACLEIPGAVEPPLPHSGAVISSPPAAPRCAEPSSPPSRRVRGAARGRARCRGLGARCSGARVPPQRPRPWSGAASCAPHRRLRALLSRGRSSDWLSASNRLPAARSFVWSQPLSPDLPRCPRLPAPSACSPAASPIRHRRARERPFRFLAQGAIIPHGNELSQPFPRELRVQIGFAPAFGHGLGLSPRGTRPPREGILWHPKGSIASLQRLQKPHFPHVHLNSLFA